MQYICDALNGKAWFRIETDADPYPQHDAAIAALEAYYGLTLDRDRCFPYR